MLVNYQTTREQASWLKDWYTKRNTPVQSFGCAWTPSASDLPMQHIPNLVMSPGKNEETFDSLVAGIKRGVAVMGANPRVDFQAKNGIIARPRMREIINGKLGNLLTGGGILFNSTELWKNVIAIGGAGSVQPFTGTSTKGQPEQSCSYSLTTVPMVVKNVSIIDVKRRA